jgi:prepilin-type N-terminal cleavage/methylation domain-containing protein/prepilin-type processing-associated H-X9-DG protein
MNVQRTGSPVRAAFTLIELLVVIAIIATLAAILFPVFAQARDKARQSVCLSNMKQMGTAFYMYVQDYDETFPLDGHTSGEESWVFNLYPYTKNLQIYRCPNDKSANWYPENRTANARFTSYGTNSWMAPFVPGYSTPNTSGYTTLASVNSPASTIYCAEVAENRNYDHFHAPWWRPNPDGQYTPPGPNGPAELVTRQHQGGANYFFCDGHAKWMRWEQTWTRDGRTDLYDPRR